MIRTSRPAPPTMAWVRLSRRGGCRGRGRGRGGAAAAPRLRDLGKIRLWSEQPEVLDESLGQGVRLRVALEMPDGVGTADRIGLSQEVVAQPDLGVRVGATYLRQRGARSRSHLVGGDAQQRADVVVALPPFEQQLQHRALFIRDRHERGSLGQRREP
jgi:hypothetical protein